MNNPWSKQADKPLFMLAPMEAVTDTVFRHVIKKAAAPDIFFSEFVSTDGYASQQGRHSTRNRLLFTEDEQPVIAQIWGNKPKHYALMAQDLKRMGYRGIDINMGCPDKAVVKQGSGSGLIHNKALSSEIINATKQAGLPVSVKTRLGDIRADEWKPWLTHLLSQNLSNLTVHLRSRKEMSKVPAHYEYIKDIVNLKNKIAPQTLITINGDIRDYQHGIELYRRYQIDGIMIGRGVFANPFAFSKLSAPPTINQLLSLFWYHLDQHDKYEKEYGTRKYDPLKRFYKIYIKDFAEASKLRHQLMQTRNTQEAREVATNFFTYYPLKERVS